MSKIAGERIATCIATDPCKLSGRFAAKLTKVNFPVDLFFFPRTRAAADRWSDVPPPTQETIMRTQLRAGAVALVFLGSVGFAVAQTPSGSQHEKLNLSQAKERMVTQGLASEPTQSPAGFQGQIGSKAPDSAQAKALPSSVTDQVPETKRFLFIKMPDRIVLIDPDDKLVAEIVPVPATTGSSPGGMAPSSPGGMAPGGSPSR